MKRIFVVVMAVVALCASAQPSRPKLVVGLVVDQMRWDYLYNYQWGEGGFKTLLQDGYLCNNTIIDYVPTVTAAGHASIYTGTTPAIHGIAGNNFMLNGKNVTSVQDDSERSVGGNDKTSCNWPPISRAVPWASPSRTALPSCPQGIIPWAPTGMTRAAHRLSPVPIT